MKSFVYLGHISGTQILFFSIRLYIKLTLLQGILEPLYKKLIHKDRIKIICNLSTFLL